MKQKIDINWIKTIVAAAERVDGICNIEEIRALDGTKRDLHETVGSGMLWFNDSRNHSTIVVPLYSSES